MLGRHKLTDRQVRSAPAGKLLGDGNGLYLTVRSKAARSWLLIYRHDGKRVELGLGAYPAVSLAQARELAAYLQSARATGIDAKQARDNRRQGAMTFGQAAEQMVADLEPGWTARHRRQVHRNLIIEATALADLPIASIGTEDVLRLLQPLWLAKPGRTRRHAIGFDPRQPHQFAVFGEKASLEGVVLPLAHRHEADLYLNAGVAKHRHDARRQRAEA
jgi:hypothetical protein